MAWCLKLTARVASGSLPSNTYRLFRTSASHLHVYQSPGLLLKHCWAPILGVWGSGLGLGTGVSNAFRGG